MDKPSRNKSDSIKNMSQTLNYQLEILKEEINYIQTIFDRIDKITQTTKNWAVIIWAGSISLILTNKELWFYIPIYSIYSDFVLDY